MKKGRIPWLVVSGLVVAALVLASCTAATEEPGQAQTVTGKVTEKKAAPAPAVVEKKAAEKEVVAVDSGDPKYGGTIFYRWPADPSDFDQTYVTAWRSYTMDMTNEQLVALDWTKGPAGSKKLAFVSEAWPPDEDLVGHLVEEWKLEPERWTLKIRQGVRFHDKPPVNGREMEARDVGVSIERMFGMATSFMYRLTTKPTAITYPDKYTVVLDFPRFDFAIIQRVWALIFVVPYDVVWDADGNETEALRDWRNAVGTGPWTLDDYVPSVSLTFGRNPNYWQSDPNFPQNQLPYADQLVVKIMPELSTAVAALRTGKIDIMQDVPWDQAQALMRTNPELRSASAIARSAIGMAMRTDLPPLNDIRVRQALNMAIDRQQIVDDLYHGEAVYFVGYNHPTAPHVWAPYEDLPANVKEVYAYNPEKARALLAEAGYPEGFEIEIMTNPTYENEPVLIASYWEAIGVKTNIDRMDPAAFTTKIYAKTYTGFVMTGGGSSPKEYANPDHYATDHYTNFSIVSDPWWDDARFRVAGIIDDTERNALYNEMREYALEKAWSLPLPTPNQFVLWQPRVKNYEGGYFMSSYHFFLPLTWVWLDR